MASLTELAAQLEPDLARLVFTHSSWASERILSYERLEFLGDSVLGVCISTHIYEQYPEYDEGALTKMRAYVISRHACAEVGSVLGLGERLVAAADTAAVNVESLARNANVLAAVVEALIGALYLQFGLERIMNPVIEAFKQHIDFAASDHVDYKTALQEEAAAAGMNVEYRLVSTEGPPHDRYFTSEVLLDGERLGGGRGRSKKVSQQESAKEALEGLRARREKGNA